METNSALSYKSFSLAEAIRKRGNLILVLLFFLSLALRFHEYYYFREMNTDKARQLEAAYELLQGHGVSLESYNLTTFQPAFVPIVEWPPGYSFLIAGTSFFTGGNVYKASFILDALALTGLWVCLLWLTSLLQFELLPRCALFLFLGISKPPLNEIPSADLCGTVAFLAACGLAVWHMSKPLSQRKPLVFFGGQSVFLFIMVSLKYSLLPACFAIGASFIVYSFFSKENFYKTGLALLGLFGVCLFAVFLYNDMRSGHLNGLYNRYASPERHLHLSNLTLFNPFIIATFFHLDVFRQRFNIPVVQAVAVAATAALFIVIVIAIFQKIKKSQAVFFDHLVYTVIISVVAFLAALSVYLPKDIHPTLQWTYVKDFRYFAPAVFMVLLYLLKNFRFEPKRKNLQTMLSVFTTASMAFALLLGIYYWMIHNQAASYANLNEKYWRIQHVVDSLKNDQTYFISLTAQAGDDPGGRLQDTKAASVIATSGTKVIVSGEGYFPVANYSALFADSVLLAPGKQIIVFIDRNTKLLDSLNLHNRHQLGQTAYGEKYLVINN